MRIAEDIIRELNLQPHPEGGWYAETWRAPLAVGGDVLPERFAGPRDLAASIHFLLERGSVSRLHRLHAEELWFHLDGGAIELAVLDESGTLTTVVLGKDDEQTPFAAIPSGSWFGASLTDGSPWALVACVTAPAFEFEDFELGHRDLLLAQFPQHADLIRRLT